ncbi:PilZ domain-containing protein [Acidovorax sp. Leaf160]|uniref:PilZ domain-containing protein n=1 Tax=Acidovorax sp. Leaf160 TaxID=1736280 RepID=UPI0006F9FD37|nr:PilZ domain-containing protein [Acidovorax sp. Leaf160]KQR55385.1 pilus assembly protein PilZ [Acidovorax sp. Leaf160]
MPSERRHFVRIGFQAPAQFTTGHGTFAVQVLDLSLKGALLQVPPDMVLAVGMFCQLALPLQPGEAHIGMSAEVAHIDGEQVGVLCRVIDLDSVTHLRRLIELQLEDPALLERELGELAAPAP